MKSIGRCKQGLETNGPHFVTTFSQHHNLPMLEALSLILSSETESQNDGVLRFLSRAKSYKPGVLTDDEQMGLASPSKVPLMGFQSNHIDLHLA